jgi:hypothetical protein
MDTDAIRAEVEKIQGDLMELKNKRKALDERIAPKEEELNHFTAILNLRQATSDGNGTVSIRLNVPAGVSLPQALAAISGDPAEYGAKAKAMRALALSRNGTGVTMREFVEEGKRIGALPQLAYQWVNRQRKSKPQKLEKRGKKFYATEAMRLD